MRNKLIYCIPLALSITCLIGCASKAAQTPADPEATTMLPSQEQQAIVPKDTKGKMLFTPQQSEHENTPMRAAESVVTDAPVIAKTGVTQAAPEPLPRRASPRLPSTPRRAMWSRSRNQHRNLTLLLWEPRTGRRPWMPPTPKPSPHTVWRRTEALRWTTAPTASRHRYQRTLRRLRWRPRRGTWWTSPSVS